MPSNRKYRASIEIMFQILEELLKKKELGVIKSQIYKKLSLRTSIGKKYLTRLEKGGYIHIEKESYGESRFRNRVKITKLGIKRFNWFINITTELDFKDEKNDP